MQTYVELNRYIDASARRSDIDRTRETTKSGVYAAASSTTSGCLGYTTVCALTMHAAVSPLRPSPYPHFPISLPCLRSFSGMTAVHPLTGEELPIWVADYVLAGYGTGAVMAVPAHDERDFDFAKAFDLPMKQVVAQKAGASADAAALEEALTSPGVCVNSGDGLDGLSTDDAKAAVIERLEANGRYAHGGSPTIDSCVRHQGRRLHPKRSLPPSLLITPHHSSSCSCCVFARCVWTAARRRSPSSSVIGSSRASATGGSPSLSTSP